MQNRKEFLNTLMIGGIATVLPSSLFSKPGHFGHQVLLNGDKVLRAGAATLDVTPFLGAGIVGNYGIPPAAENIHDPLFAKALVLDDGFIQLVFVVIDSLGIHAQVCEAAKETITMETGIPASQIIIAVTHTHSGPSAGGVGEKRRAYDVKPFDDYQLFLIHRIIDAVKNAVYNLRPARIGFGHFDKPEHVFNRRWEMKKQVMNPFGFLDSTMMNPGYRNPNKLTPSGPTDPEVAFIAVETLEGQAIAVLANYSLHYVGGVPKSDISADYYGLFTKRIAALLGTENQDIPFVGIMCNGTSGDINNNNYAQKAEKYPPYKKMELVANDLAESLVKAYAKLDFRDWAPLKAAVKKLFLTVRKSTPELRKKLEKIKEKKEGDKPVYHALEDTYLERIIQHDMEYPDRMPVTLQAFVIGDVAVGAIPFEVFAETGLALKQQNPFKKSFTIGIANGYWGYLPTSAQHQRGGYETWLTANKVQVDAADIIQEEFLKLFKSMQ